MRLLRRGSRSARMLPTARDFLGQASEESRRLGHDYVGSEHLLLALAGEGGGRAAAVLRRLGVTADDVRADILADIGTGFGAPAARIDRDALATLGIDFDEVRRRIEATFGQGALERTTAACMPVCPRAKRALQHASENAAGPVVADEDVLTGLVSVEDSLAARILAARGELVRKLRRDAALFGGFVGERLELLGARLDCPVALHRLPGGFSPVATRQIPEAARRAAIVATAPSAP